MQASLDRFVTVATDSSESVRAHSRTHLTAMGTTAALLQGVLRW